MLSYQHAYHAGNRADVLKHAILHAIFSDMAGETRPVFYVETHAGRGRYDLTGPEARKTAEADEGVSRILSGQSPRILRPWLELLQSEGRQAYPGSPALAALTLPDNARLALFEKHPAEFKALKAALGQNSRIQIRQADGYSGALKLAPRRNETLCVFVDPSYETARDMDALADWAPRALKRWPDAIIILWLPLFKDEREADFGAYLAGLEDGVVAGARWPTGPDDDSALSGSALVAYRIGNNASQAALAIASALQSYWSQ